jgi:hypothetical protein
MDLSKESRQLIDLAAEVDSPPPRARHLGRQRLVGALAAGTLTTSVVVAKGAALGATAVGTVSTLGATSSVTTTLVSAILIGFSAGLVVISPTTRSGERAAVSLDTPEAKPKRFSARTAATVAPMPKHPVEATKPAQEIVVDVATVTHRSESVPAVSAPSKPPKASIARETALLAEVQRALTARQPGRALEALDRYTAECPTGLLYEEATASRVVALCSAGRVQDGRRWAEEFTRRYPNSPLASRVSSACPKAPEVETP